MTTDIINSGLVKTLDKATTRAMFKLWRSEATSADEADVCTDAIKAIDSGELDG